MRQVVRHPGGAEEVGVAPTGLQVEDTQTMRRSAFPPTADAVGYILTPLRGLRSGLIACASITGLLVDASDVLAKVTQEEFLRSVSNQGGEPVSPGKILSVVGGGLVVLLLLFLLHQLQKRRAGPRVVRNHGKLMREVLRQAPLKGVDMKRLKALAEAKGCSSPLTLLLCPSLVQKGSGKAQ